ncbi:hypothetical protein [Streptantibioticus silvisoli]|uniref:Gram-positive cocci surface proteins LPxTG domain-containing protein n=1 Tax=Streptantibioticus silvisoli TaxID=2705255 RepID=A0ABT6W434_9ACTN|nr:hypothetical protein [Streptantibioticus silvisoli]MDI5964281.1 hypothetical protein [Streptantibioticus silvisoli]
MPVARRIRRRLPPARLASAVPLAVAAALALAPVACAADAPASGGVSGAARPWPAASDGRATASGPPPPAAGVPPTADPASGSPTARPPGHRTPGHRATAARAPGHRTPAPGDAPSADPDPPHDGGTAADDAPRADPYAPWSPFTQVSASSAPGGGGMGLVADDAVGAVVADGGEQQHPAPGGDPALAGNRAGEGRPHPGRDADHDELGLPLGRGAVWQLTSGDGPDGAGPDGGGADGVGAGPAGGADLPRQADPGAESGADPGTEAGAATGQVVPALPPVPGGAARNSTAWPPGGASGGSSATRAPGEPVPGRSGPARAAGEEPQTAAGPAGRALRVLPFGTGLALLGAGLGVLAVRQRRR